MRPLLLPMERARRARVARLLLAGILLVLGGSFFRVQILGLEEYRLRAERNRLRPLVLPAPRGSVFDREGRVIAENVPGWSLSLFPAPADSLRASLNRLAPFLGLGSTEIERLLERSQRERGRLLEVRSNLPVDAVASIAERQAHFPEVLIEMAPRRSYPAGDAIGHVVGYVGEVSPEELESDRFRGVRPGSLVGKEGLERSYESRLSGGEGTRFVEVDARGRVVGSFLGTERIEPAPGEDLHLTLDLPLQQEIRRLFPDSLSGAVVALDPEDGGILALYSHPGFDPNAFVGGIDRATWEALTSDPRRPLYNRAVLGLYAPASTFKPVVAAMALDAGLLDPLAPMPVPCTGTYGFGNRTWRCWSPEGHGFQDLAGALATSCNVYFYQLGLRVGLDRFLQQAGRMGFNRTCGVDLPAESPGVFPEDREYWRTTYGYRPTEGEVLSLSIGQGPNAQTVLKMAQVFLALARDGTAPEPTLVRGASAGEGWSLQLSPLAIRVIRDGLGAVTAPGGTAHLSSLEYWDLIGKTGSGQAANRERPYSWFAGMAGPWGGDPEIVIVVLVESGEGGSSSAAPVAAKAVDLFLRDRYGLPQDSVRTLRDHLRVGRPAPWAGRRGEGVRLPGSPGEEGRVSGEEGPLSEPDRALDSVPVVFPGPVPSLPQIPETGRPPSAVLPLPFPLSIQREAAPDPGANAPGRFR